MSRVRIAFALAAMVVSTPFISPANAQQSDEESILVEGQRTSVNRLVSDTIEGAGYEPLARFEDKICPGVVGLGLVQAGKLADLIRANILALGGKLEVPGCTPNATVIVVDQPVDFVKQFATREPAFFAMTPRQLDDFTSRPRAVASWHVTETRDRDGQELDGSDKVSDRKRKLFTVNAPSSAPINARVVRQSAATRLYTNTREDMMFGFAVIEREKLAGKSLRQLADFVTLHLLLDVKQNAGSHNRASILSLFEERPAGAAAPTALSQYDKAMIEGLYAAAENNRTPAQQFSQIATAIRRSSGKDK